MKKIFLLLIFSTSVHAGSPYIEYKRVDAWKNTDYLNDVNYLRAGYKWDNWYVEVGPGYAEEWLETWEAGYKFKLNSNWTLKGKWEGVHKKDTAHKLETELRYTF